MDKIIDIITTWELPDTKEIPDGYDRKSVPEATSRNMYVYMKTINELVAQVNILTEKLSKLSEL